MVPIGSAIRDAFALLDQRLRRPLELSPPSRQPLLDPDTTLLCGDLALLGARNEHDAEQVLHIVALESARRRDVLIVAPDVRWTELQLASIASGIPTDRIDRCELDAEEMARVRAAAEEIAALPIEVSNAIVHMGELDVVAAWLEAHVGGLAVLPAAWYASFGADEDRAASFLRSLKEIARRADGAILIPWRVADHRRADQRPQLRDLAVSGAAEDDADLVLLFHASEYGIEIYMAKNRHGATRCIFDSRDLT